LLGNIRSKGVGCSGGGDDEVSGRDTSRGASVRCPEAPLTLTSRSVGVHSFHFFGRWVVWALGGRQGRPRGVGWWVLGVGCSRATNDEVSGRDTLQGASVRYPKAPLKLASRTVGVHFFHFLGVGSPGRWVVWALGGRQGHPRVVRSTTRSLYRDFDSQLGGPDRAHHDGIVAVAIGAL